MQRVPVLHIFFRRSVARVARPLIQCQIAQHRTISSVTETHMPIPKELLDILVCPVCKAPVKLLADGSGLKCGACRRVYPVRDDIPVMLPEEATIAPE
jgi:uncharacterized protein YbaR (Trm112 family)